MDRGDLTHRRAALQAAQAARLPFEVNVPAPSYPIARPPPACV